MSTDHPDPAEDPFATAVLREGVLAGWRSSPTRFREDANAESDLVRGGYRDRLLVELAQNAADAAARSGELGRLRLRCADGVVYAANTGAPLDAAGVASLASLRASAKRDGTTVGRFGVGFAAVVAVSDAPRVVSRPGGVAFDAARTAAEVAADPALAAELERRGGQAPVLRLVWPAVEPGPPAGFDTEVRLPLRADVDGAQLLADCAGQAGDLLLALPWLHRIEVAGHVARREDGDPIVVHEDQTSQRWRLVREAGPFSPDAVSGLGPEPPQRWELCWALPVDPEGTPQPLSGEVLHAPTPTAERLSLPARLIATVPLEPSRRLVYQGAATGEVLSAAVAAYSRLVEHVPADHRLALVPTPGFPAGETDGTLREGILDALRSKVWLRTEAGDTVAPRDARVLAQPLPELAAVLAEVLDGLLPAELSRPPYTGVLTALGVERVEPVAIAELLSGVDREPEWWWRCYAALAPLVDADPHAAEELGALPVPLADGRMITGPRGVVLGDEDILAGLSVPQLRLVQPRAAHPVLERLGARRVDAAALLDALAPAVERSVRDAADDVDVTDLVAAVARLVPRLAEPLSWLGALALPDVDREPCRADELVLPDGALRGLLAPDAPLGVLHQEITQHYPREVLAAIGVLDGFAVLDVADPIGADHDLADEEDWWAAHWQRYGEEPSRLLAVRDLDLVDDAAWPAALRLLAAESDTRAAVLQRGGYTGWWLARYASIGGRAPTRWALPGTDLGGLYEPVPAELAGKIGTGLDTEFLVAIGVRAAVAVSDTDEADDLLARLADRHRVVSPSAVHAAHAALAAAVADGVIDPDELDVPSLVRAITGEVIPADDAAVLDAPWLAEVLPAGGLVAGAPDTTHAAALAELLDLPVASEVCAATPVPGQHGEPTAWADLVEVVLTCAALARPVPDGQLFRYDRLVVSVDGARRDVSYWVDDDGTVHAVDVLRALIATLGAR